MRRENVDASAMGFTQAETYNAVANLEPKTYVR